MFLKRAFSISSKGDGKLGKEKERERASGKLQVSGPSTRSSHPNGSRAVEDRLPSPVKEVRAGVGSWAHPKKREGRPGVTGAFSARRPVQPGADMFDISISLGSSQGGSPASQKRSPAAGEILQKPSPNSSAPSRTGQPAQQDRLIAQMQEQV